MPDARKDVPARSPHRPVLPGVLLLLTLAANPAAGAEPTGRLEGTVTLGPEIERHSVRFPLYADHSRQATTVTEPGLEDEVKNVIIYVEGIDWKNDGRMTRRPAHVMSQVNEAFEPHVLPVLAGATVEFPNSDPFFHNVFSLSRAGAFDLGHFPRGTSRSVRFDEPGIVKVFCHLHADMSAVILVRDNPFFTVPDDDGSFAIPDVPPGDHEVVAWHERAQRIVRRVSIREGEKTRIDFRIPIRDQERP